MTPWLVIAAATVARRGRTGGLLWLKTAGHSEPCWRNHHYRRRFRALWLCPTTAMPWGHNLFSEEIESLTDVMDMARPRSYDSAHIPPRDQCGIGRDARFVYKYTPDFRASLRLAVRRVRRLSSSDRRASRGFELARVSGVDSGHVRLSRGD